MTRIAVLRCEKLPSFVTWVKPDFDAILEEDYLLIRELQAAGFQASSVVWNNPDIDWSRYDIAIIRSTWDYLDQPEHFLRVLSRIEASSCRLYNPRAAVRWNMDKRYLLDLDRLGVPVIPTYFAADHDNGKLSGLFAENRWPTAVLKPVVGLGAAGVYRVPANEIGRTIAGLKISQPGRAYLVQPYIDAITAEGEWSYIYFNRRLSHVVLKKPAQHDYRVQGIYGGTLQPAHAQPADVQQADAVMAKIPFDALYARLDFLRVGGLLTVMEVELIEPILSLDLAPGSAGRLVSAIQNRLEER